MCPKKQRYADKDTIGSRIGFTSFARFFELTMKQPKKTFTDFINSPYYLEFIKFGRYVAQLDPINSSAFVDFLIKNGAKLKDWTKDGSYEIYLKDYINREPVTNALDRTISTMDEWARENKECFNEFFKLVTTFEAVHLIRNGRISPWVLYIAESAGELLGRMSSEQLEMILAQIDPGDWQDKFARQKDDVTMAKEIIEAAGL